MKKGNMRPCVGGVILMVAAILSLLSIEIFPMLQVFQQTSRLMLKPVFRLFQDGWSLFLRYAVTCDLPLLAVGVVLMLKPRRELAAGAAATAAVLTTVMSLVISLGAVRMTVKDLYFVSYLPYQHRMWNLLQPLVYLLLFALSFVGMSPKLEKLKKLWFLPGMVSVLQFLVGLISLIITVYAHQSQMYNPGLEIWGLIPAILLGLLTAMGFFLAGHWLAYPERRAKAAPAYRPPVQNTVYQQPVQPQPQYQQPVRPMPQPQPPAQAMPVPRAETVVEELNQYRGLLDNGTITQEEFDAIKKRLLNL